MRTGDIGSAAEYLIDNSQFRSLDWNGCGNIFVISLFEVAAQ